MPLAAISARPRAVGRVASHLWHRRAVASEAVPLAIVVAVSSRLLLQFGMTGFHWHDLSIPFDGGYRILSGQLPFVDFVSPTGPVLFIQQAIVFSVLGVSLRSFLLHAVLLNGIAVVLSYLVFRRFDRVVGFASASVTAVWFFLPVAAPYIDSVAFFWSLVATCLFALAPTPQQDGPTYRALTMALLSGVAAALSILTKQNIGLPAAAGLLLIWALDSRRAFLVPLMYTTGVLLVLVVFIAYLVTAGGWSNFVYYAIQLPLEANRQSALMPQAYVAVYRTLRKGIPFALSTREAMQDVMRYAPGLLLAGMHFQLRDTWRGRLAILAPFWGYLSFVAYVTSNNDWPLYCPLIGLVAASTCLLFMRRGVVRIAVVSAFALSLTFLGYDVSRQRIVHTLDPEAQTHELTIPGLEGLRLEPRIGRDLEAWYEYAESELGPSETFFVYPHASILYGVLGRPSPQPLLWFHAGVTYSGSNPEPTARAVVEALRRDGTRILFLGGHPTDLPALMQMIEREYVLADEIGSTFDVYIRAGE